MEASGVEPVIQVGDIVVLADGIAEKKRLKAGVVAKVTVIDDGDIKVSEVDSGEERCWLKPEDLVVTATFDVDEYACPICMDTLYKPCVNACGHTFCFWCMHQVISVQFPYNLLVFRAPPAPLVLLYGILRAPKAPCSTKTGAEGAKNTCTRTRPNTRP